MFEQLLAFYQQFMEISKANPVVASVLSVGVGGAHNFQRCLGLTPRPDLRVRLYIVKDTNMDNKLHIPCEIIKDDFKYWEHIWPRISLLYTPKGLLDPVFATADKMAEQYAFLCHHHDKCIQYRDLWEEHGAPWRWAVMLYMLSFTQYKGERCHVGEWVGRYTREVMEEIRVLSLFERELERQFFQDDLQTYEIKLLQIASNWVRGKTPTVHTSSFVHTGHSTLEKMQLATRIARTLKDVSVMHCWRHAHGELTSGDSDFITQFTFPKWDAE